MHNQQQDYSHLVAYAAVTYSADRASASVEIRATHKDPSVALSYTFGSAKPQSASTAQFAAGGTKGPVAVSVSGSDGTKIMLDPLDFVWDVAPLKARTGDYRNGQKGAVVEFFGWPDKDVEKECAFLAQAGYLGAKLFPHHEQVCVCARVFVVCMCVWVCVWGGGGVRLALGACIICVVRCWQCLLLPRHASLAVAQTAGWLYRRRLSLLIFDARARPPCFAWNASRAKFGSFLCLPGDEHGAVPELFESLVFHVSQCWARGEHFVGAFAARSLRACAR